MCVYWESNPAVHIHSLPVIAPYMALSIFVNQKAVGLSNRIVYCVCLSGRTERNRLIYGPEQDTYNVCNSFPVIAQYMVQI